MSFDLNPYNAQLKLFSGQASRTLAEKIARELGVPLGKVTINKFSDGEIQPSYDETVRGDYVFIVQSTYPPADNLMELLLMIDAAFRASAYKIIAVMPYFGYARQDRKDKPRVSIGAKLVANMLHAAGVSRIVTMDLHADQIQGFFDVPVDHLFASSVFIPELRSRNIENLVVAAPDTGGVKRANAYAKFLDSDLVICHKTRPKANVVSEIRVIGDVRGRNVVLVDDIVDTAGTIVAAAKKMKELGALSVRAVVSHPVLSGPAYERICNSELDELIVTDSIPLRHQCDKITVLTIAPLFADVIRNVFEQKSISDNFIQKSSN